MTTPASPCRTTGVRSQSPDRGSHPPHPSRRSSGRHHLAAPGIGDPRPPSCGLRRRLDAPHKILARTPRPGDVPGGPGPRIRAGVPCSLTEGVAFLSRLDTKRTRSIGSGPEVPSELWLGSFHLVHECGRARLDALGDWGGSRWLGPRFVRWSHSSALRHSPPADCPAPRGTASQRSSPRAGPICAREATGMAVTAFATTARCSLAARVAATMGVAVLTGPWLGRLHRPCVTWRIAKTTATVPPTSDTAFLAPRTTSRATAAPAMAAGRLTAAAMREGSRTESGGLVWCCLTVDFPRSANGSAVNG